LAVDAPEWIRSFDGSRVVIQDETKNLVWTENVLQAAQSVQQLAEGEEIRKPKMGRSPLMIVIYVFAAFSFLEFLFLLLALGVSLIIR
jgi:hypothetical protein